MCGGREEGGATQPPPGGRKGNGRQDGPLHRETLGSRRLGKAGRAESHVSGAGDTGARTGT